MNLLITIIVVLALITLCYFLYAYLDHKDYQLKKNLVVNHIFARKKTMPQTKLHDVEKIALCDLLKETITSKNKRAYDNIRLVIMLEYPQHVESVMAYEANLRMGHLGYSDEELIETHRNFKEATAHLNKRI